MDLRICGSLKSTKNDWVRLQTMVRKSQIRKLPHLRQVRKSSKIESANLHLLNLFADRPPLNTIPL
jgi:hypothetical protein